MAGMGLGLARGAAPSGAASVSADAAGYPSRRFAMLDRDAAAAIATEWRSLAARTVEDNAFFDPDFVLPAMAAIGGRVRIATWRQEDGMLGGLVPVTDTRLGRIAPAIRVWCHEYAPLGVPLIDRSAMADAVAGLLTGTMAREASLLLPDLPTDGPVAGAIATWAAACGRPLAIIDHHRRAMLARPPSGVPDWRAALSLRRRKGYGRQMRRLAERGDLAVETTSEPGEVRIRFEEFLVLEAAGWKGGRGTALAMLPAIATMAREIVARRAAERASRIDSIRLDGRPIAMLVSFLAGTTAYTWKTAFDEGYARFSPGALLMLEAGESLLAIPGIERIDSCATANHPMVNRLWQDRLAIGTMIVGPVGGSALYSAGLAAARIDLRARAVARRMLRRR